MATIDFEGTEVPIKEGDTIAAALYRGGDAHLLPVVQVPPPARPVLRRRRLPELPRHRRRRGQRPRVRVPRERRPEGDAAERVAVGRPRRARHHRPLPLALPVGFYYKAGIKPKFAWPMIEPMIRKMAGLGVVDSQRRARATSSAGTGTPTCSSSAPASPASSAALAAAGDGRSVMLIDENETPAPASRPVRRGRASTRCVREVDASDAITTSWNTPATGLFEGPLLIAICGDETYHVHPQAIVIACGGREIHAVFTQQRPARRDAGPRRRAARRRARRAGRATAPSSGPSSPRRCEHVRTLAAPASRSRPSWRPRRSTPAASTAEVIRGEITAATGKKRVKGVVRRRPARSSATCSRSAPRSRPTSTSSGWPTTCPPSPPATRPARARRWTRPLPAAPPPGTPPRPGRRSTPSAPSAPRTCGTDGTVCLCEDVSVKDARGRDRRGHRVGRAAEAVHDGHHGPLPGPHVRRPAADRRRAQGPRARSASRTATTLRPPTRSITLERGHRRRRPPHRAAHRAARDAPRRRRIDHVGRAVEARRGLQRRRRRASTGRCASASA